MNAIHTVEIKTKYTIPKIECVKLDNEISLALQSAPPGGPGEVKLPEHFKNDPYQQMT